MSTTEFPPEKYKQKNFRYDEVNFSRLLVSRAINSPSLQDVNICKVHADGIPAADRAR